MRDGAREIKPMPITRASPATKTHIQDIHKTEPYVYSQMITGKEHPAFGRAKNSWLTGTSAWSLKSATQWLLGIRPEFTGLLIDPCIPAEWDNVSITRRFRNALYNITIENPDHVSKGVTEVVLDGTPISGNLLPIPEPGQNYDVQSENGVKICLTTFLSIPNFYILSCASSISDLCNNRIRSLQHRTMGTCQLSRFCIHIYADKRKCGPKIHG